MKYSKIVVFGGASTLWSPREIIHMARSHSANSAEVVLVDIDLARATALAEVMNRVVKRACPESSITVTAAALEEALPGAEAVFTVYRNAGAQTESRINDITRKYGPHQNCFTAGPGACLYVAVQAPPLLKVVEAMKRHCPEAYLINCSNPLPALGMLAAKAGLNGRKVLGFCGAWHWIARGIARFLDVEENRVHFRIGGTNHCTFLTEIYVDGKDAYPLVRKKAEEKGRYDLGEWGYTTMPVQLLKHIGYLTPGGHESDIFPTLESKWSPPDNASPTAEWRPGFFEMLKDYADGKEVDWQPPQENDVPITWLDALAGRSDGRRFTVNTANLGVVSNLPDWAVPDLECILDERGVSPVAGPPLPEVIAEVVRRHQVTFEMSARAALTRDHELLVQAIQLCPFGDFIQSARSIVEEARTEFGSELIF